MPDPFSKNNEGIVNQGVNYRGYSIHHDGTEYVAESEVGDGECFEISSNTREGLYRAIDELWTHLDATTDFERMASVPAWYQAWLDDGADGRVRVLDCGRHESISPSRKWWGLGKLLAGSMVCAVAFVAVPKLDVNKDGSINIDDAARMIEKVHVAFRPEHTTRRIRFKNVIYDLDLMSAPEDDIDYDAKSVTVGGAPVIRVFTQTATVMGSPTIME